jgi:hypothetical protein
LAGQDRFDRDTVGFLFAMEFPVTALDIQGQGYVRQQILRNARYAMPVQIGWTRNNDVGLLPR